MGCEVILIYDPRSPVYHATFCSYPETHNPFFSFADGILVIIYNSLFVPFKYSPLVVYFELTHGAIGQIQAD